MARNAPPAPDLTALRDRARIIRRHIVEMLHEAASGHPGGSLSAVEVVTALYFGGILRHDPKRADWPERDRFVLSKGHGVPVQYAALAEAGYLPHDELRTLRQVNSRLQGHPVLGTAPGIEASTGSLGQGLSIALGMALAARLDGSDYRVYCLMGDGECQEGQVWEAAMAAGHHRPDNLIAIVDNNKFQLDGATADIIGLEPFAAKWQAFGWSVREIDGHDIGAVMDALVWAADNAPACIIANTVKGKGVSFMEGENAYHGVAPSTDELARALNELAGEDPEEQHAHALGSDRVLEQAEKSIDADAKGGAR